MPTLYVFPQEVAALLDEEGFDYTRLNSDTHWYEGLSATDLADIELALKRFEFRFDQKLGIQLAQTPSVRLALDGENHETLLMRVSQRLGNASIAQALDETQLTGVYTLNPVNEQLWVAVEQRVPAQSSDPTRARRSANSSFFSAMIEQLLHTHSFEFVCDSNLFTHYVTALPHGEAA